MDITLKFIGGILSQKKLFILINLVISILIFILPLAFFQYGKSKILSSISIIASLSFIVLSTVNVHSIKAEYSKFAETHTQTSEPVMNTKFSLSKTGKNVVVIMLDRAESSYFEHIVKDNPELKNIYSGFTYYPNTVSFNGHTLMASPALYGGYEYTPAEMNKRDNELLSTKHNEATLVLPRILTEQADFTAQMYDTSWGNYSYVADMSFTNDYEKINGGILNGLYTGDFKTNFEEYDDSLIQDSVCRNLFFTSIFRASPAVLRPIIYYKGTWWASEDVSDIDSFIDWYGQLYYMPQLTDFDNPENSLIIFTNEATHCNENIEKLNLVNHSISFENDDNGYLIDVVSLEAVGKWLQYLKANDVYDNTRIIIVADHGIGYGPTYTEKFNNELVNDYPKDQLNPLLLFKDFNEDGELKSDFTFMTNADTPHLAIKDLVEKPYNPFTNSAFDNSAKNNGVIITTDDIFMPHHSKSNKTYTVRKDSLFTVKENIFDDKNWAPANY